MIPITFNKDDNSNLKKGNIRGQDLASILSFGITKKSGILDIWRNPVSVASNVASTGYSILTLNKGYVCIYGRLIYVEQGEQVQVALPSGSSTINGTLGIRINLGNTGASEVEWFAKTGDLRQDNILDDEVQGVFEFGIYRYTATVSGLTLGDKIAPIISDISVELTNVLNSSKAYTDEQRTALQENLQQQIDARTFLGQEVTLYAGSSGDNKTLADNISNYKFLYFNVKVDDSGGQVWYTSFDLTTRIANEISQYGECWVRLRTGSNAYVTFYFKGNGNKVGILSSGSTIRYAWVVGIK